MSCCQHLNNKQKNVTGTTFKELVNATSTSFVHVCNMTCDKLCYLCGSTMHASSDCPHYA
ncbi:hypothetical protein BDC45DRAFT_497146 [Circinella umbellata]|nr:hypothetical protein BDC45DRAFT_497146 [Circinella umbellata]